MIITREKIIEALSHVDDPDLNKDIVTLNMVRDLEIEDNIVKFSVILTTPACPLKEVIKNACITAIHHLVDPNLEINITMGAEVTRREEPSMLSNIKNIIAVASGKGGVGKSTISTNIAVSLANIGARVGILDADLYGPSIPAMFGLPLIPPKVRKVNGKDMMLPFTKYGVQVNSIGFLVPAEQAIVWRGPMASKALLQLVFDTVWDDLDYLIVDLPPGTGDIHISIAQQIPLTGAIVVTTPHEVAIADARKALAMLFMDAINVKVFGIIENMAYFSPDDLPEKKYFLFGKGGGEILAKEFGIELLGSLPLIEASSILVEEQKPMVLTSNSRIIESYQQIAMKLAQLISINNAQSVL